MAWRGSLSRSLISTASSSASRSSPSISAARRRRRRRRRRRLTFSNPRTMGELGDAQSLMPVQMAAAGVRLNSHFSVNARLCCELFHGTLPRTCPDR